MEPPLLGRFVHSLVTVTSSIGPLWTRGPIASFILRLSILQNFHSVTRPCRHGREVEGQTQPSRNTSLGGGVRPAPCSGRFISWKDLVPTLQESGWASGSGWHVISRPHRDLIPGQPSPQRPAIPTNLSRSPLNIHVRSFIVILNS
jgi:hypothetical protein